MTIGRTDALQQSLCLNGPFVPGKKNEYVAAYGAIAASSRNRCLSQGPSICKATIMATVTTTATRIELTTSASLEPSRRPSPVLYHEVQTEVSRKGTTAAIFASITGVTGISSLLLGMVTVMLPKMAKDLDISDAVLLGYASTCGQCTIH